MTTFTIRTAKTQLSEPIAQAERGEEVIIARGKTPVARLVPYEREEPKRGFGSMKGRATIGPEFWEPLPEEELKLWRAVSGCGCCSIRMPSFGGSTATRS